MVKKSIIPSWFGAKAMALYPFILVAPSAKMSDVDVNHERIHLTQQKELLVIGFYLWYLTEWVLKTIIKRKDAYRDLSHEREAYDSELDLDYIKNRRIFSFIKYI